MRKIGKLALTYGIGLSGIGIFAVVAGMASPSAAVSSYKGFSSRTMVALGGLRDELTRRFTDRQNISFGMERVIRPNARLHEGPVAGRFPKFEADKTYRQTAEGKVEFLVEGKWIPDELVKPKMSPENDREKASMSEFDSEKVSVAIYTVGQFAYDRGSKPGPAAQNSEDLHSNFMFGGWDDIRAKGPAYIHQDAKIAPDAYKVVDFAREAWRTGKSDYDAAGPDGWHYFAHHISAPDNSCLKCHGANGEQVIRNENGVVRKVGDPVGLFVIALKRN